MNSGHQEVRIPTLRFVNIDDLVLHEQHDQTRSIPLVERLQNDRILKNPPVVAAFGNGDSRYVVLDGANRITAMRMLNLPHLVVQVVDYEHPDVQLSTWYHLVTGCPYHDFAQALSSVENIKISPTELLRARAALARRDIISYVVWLDQHVDAIQGEGRLAERVAMLNAVVDAYKQCATIYRTQHDNIAESKQHYNDVMAVVTFPRYEPAEIIELARSGIRLPAGITRYVIHCRALRINVPLTKLAEDASLEAKNAWLAASIHSKLTNKEARYYQESTWLFDE